MKKILITGSSGFLGGRIADYFQTDQRKYQVIAPSHGEMDITDMQSVCAYFRQAKPDIVIHCAAISDVGQCEREPERSWKINVDGSIHMAKASAETGAKCILCSSDQVYFGSSLQTAHREEEALTPYNLYGREKLKAEEECLSADPGCVLLRLSWMYDVRTRRQGEHSDFFRTLCGKLWNGEKVSYPVHDVRGITDVNEVTANLEKVFQIPGGVYNFGSPNQKSTYETLRGVFEKASLDPGLLEKNEEAFLNNPRNISMCQEKMNGFGIFFLETEEGIVQNLMKYM